VKNKLGSLNYSSDAGEVDQQQQHEQARTHLTIVCIWPDVEKVSTVMDCFFMLNDLIVAMISLPARGHKKSTPVRSAQAAMCGCL